MKSLSDGVDADVESARQSAQSAKDNRNESDFFLKHIELLLNSATTTVVEIEHTTSEQY